MRAEEGVSWFSNRNTFRAATRLGHGREVIIELEGGGGVLGLTLPSDGFDSESIFKHDFWYCFTADLLLFAAGGI